MSFRLLIVIDLRHVRGGEHNDAYVEAYIIA